MSGAGANAATVLRRLIGWLVALAGVGFALSVGGFSAVIMLGYWSYEGAEGRAVLVVTTLIAILFGYAIYRLGRRIAR